MAVSDSTPSTRRASSANRSASASARSRARSASGVGDEHHELPALAAERVEDLLLTCERLELLRPHADHRVGQGGGPITISTGMGATARPP